MGEAPQVTRAKAKDYVAIAEGYAADVVSGKIPACQWAVKACRRQLDDLEKAEARGVPLQVRPREGLADLPVHRDAPPHQGRVGQERQPDRASALAGIHPDGGIRMGIAGDTGCGGSGPPISKCPEKTGSRLSPPEWALLHVPGRGGRLRRIQRRDHKRPGEDRLAGRVAHGRAVARAQEHFRRLHDGARDQPGRDGIALPGALGRGELARRPQHPLRDRGRAPRPQDAEGLRRPGDGHGREVSAADLEHHDGRVGPERASATSSEPT